jgi:hypothetical protein
MRHERIPPPRGECGGDVVLCGPVDDDVRAEVTHLLSRRCQALQFGLDPLPFGNEGRLGVGAEAQSAAVSCSIPDMIARATVTGLD